MRSASGRQLVDHLDPVADHCSKRVELSVPPLEPEFSGCGEGNANGSGTSVPPASSVPGVALVPLVDCPAQGVELGNGTTDDSLKRLQDPYGVGLLEVTFSPDGQVVGGFGSGMLANDVFL
jgi:hypothetical protein